MAALSRSSLVVSGNVDSGSATEIIIDDLDPNTESTGTWKVSSGENPWDGRSLYNNNGNLFRWLPTITTAGTYDAFVWFTHHPNRSDQVPYRVGDAVGVLLETIVDQSNATLAGKWHPIGTVTLNAGTDHYVEVSSENGQASADAVRLVSTGAAPLSVVTMSLSDGFVGQMYSETLVASGGEPPYMWSVSVGVLPAGLTLNTTTGEISGIPTTVVSETFTVEVVDDNGDTADEELTINVSAVSTEIIIDDLDPNTESTGTWKVSSGENPWDGRSLYNNNGNLFRWLPTITTAGTYDAFVWFTHHPNRSDQVPYRVGDAVGVLLETIVDQSNATLAGKWHPIGTVTLNAGTDHYVEVSSENGQASADAVRFVLQ